MIEHKIADTGVVAACATCVSEMAGWSDSNVDALKAAVIAGIIRWVVPYVFGKIKEAIEKANKKPRRKKAEDSDS